MFSKMLKASQDISDFVINTKFTASNAVGSTFGALYSQQLRVDKYLEKFNEDSQGRSNISYEIKVIRTAADTGLMSRPIDNDEKLLSMSTQEYLHYIRFNPFAYEQAMYDSNRKAVKDLAKYFPYETSLYSSIRNKIQDIGRYGTLNEDEINSIHRSIPVALLACQENSEFHGEALHMFKGSDGIYRKGTVTNREYYRESFVADLQEALRNNPELDNLEIFKHMNPKEEVVVIGKDPKTGSDIRKEVFSMDIQDVGGLDSDTKEKIKESWAYLMEVDDEGYFKNEKYAEIGKDLFMYCFYQMGFEFSPISFMHLAPTAVKDNIKVERAQSLPLKEFNEGSIDWQNPDSNDVLVWSATTPGSMERLAADFDCDRSMIDELQSKTFRLNDKLSTQSIKYLVQAAVSHPELRFKIDMDLTQEQFDLFSRSSLGMDVPANIYFSSKTLSSVSQESKEAISYGRNRTYRQFLDEILKGNHNELDLDDFAKQWILNNLDNPKFVFDTNKCNKVLKTELNTQIKSSLAVNKNSINLDLSNVVKKTKGQSKDGGESSPLDSFVKIESVNGRIISSTWCPCILYNGSYYMADSNNLEGFNIGRNLSMRYIKVNPLGSLKSFKYDNGKIMPPSIRYQSYFGETNEDLNNAEFKYTVERKEDNVEGSTENSTEEKGEDNLNIKNKDSSSVMEAFNAIKQQAKDNELEQYADWDKNMEKILNLNFEKDLDNLTFDDVYDAVEDIMRGRAWRKSSEELKDNLVSTVLDYYKNPTYLNPISSTKPESSVEGGESITLPASVREYLEDTIIKEMVKAQEKYFGTTMMQEGIQKMKEGMSQDYSDQDIIDTVEAIKKACKDGEGVIMLDEKGNMMQGC